MRDVVAKNKSPMIKEAMGSLAWGRYEGESRPDETKDDIVEGCGFLIGMQSALLHLANARQLGTAGLGSEFWRTVEAVKRDPTPDPAAPAAGYRLDLTDLAVRPGGGVRDLLTAIEISLTGMGGKVKIQPGLYSATIRRDLLARTYKHPDGECDVPSCSCHGGPKK